MKKKILTRSKRGSALVIVVIIGCIFTIIGLSVLGLAGSEKVFAQKTLKKTRAFHLAEAGVARFVANGYNGDFSDISETALGNGGYRVDVYTDVYPGYAIACGTAGNEQKRIKVERSFLSPPYEHAIYSCNLSGQNWVLELRGTGVPQDVGGGRENGGKDIVNGDMYVDGDVKMYGESTVNTPLAPNTYELNGDVSATGSIDVTDSASISGAAQTGVEKRGAPDLVAMNYKINNTHNVSKVFADEGVSSGHLSWDHELYNVVVKNPGDRVTECATTSGDDYFLEPASGFIAGTSKDGATPLDLGNDDRIYYVDGNVWIHSPQTFGFALNGKATIVATGNIYICDNTVYANNESLLGLVALGEYDSGDQLVSGGNIYFGDPRFGTTYTVSGLMFAGNDFLYNTDSVTGEAQEPETGFTVNGNFAAINQVSVWRDWYNTDGTGDAKSAYFDTSTGQWIDTDVGSVLTATEINTLRHYQMIVNYDDRVRNSETQPTGLPRGGGTIFNGITNWEELPPS